jgi:hypothetical protein
LCGRGAVHLPTKEDLPSPMNDLFLPKTSEDELENVLAFLDQYFSLGDIDLPGDATNIRYTRHTWTTVYEKYLEFCDKLHLRVARYDRFCAIR